MGISWNALKNMHRPEPPRVLQKPSLWSGMETTRSKNMHNLQFIPEILT